MLTRQTLEALDIGLTTEQLTAIEKASQAAIKDAFVPIHRFNEVNGELKTAKETLTDRDKQIADLKKFEGTNEELGKKVKELEEENKNKDKKLADELATERKKNAIRVSLMSDKDSQPHDVEMVVGMINLEQVVYDEQQGTIVSGLKEQKEKLLSEKQFLFLQPDPKGGNGGWKPHGKTPPDGGKEGKTEDGSSEFGAELAKARVKQNSAEAEKHYFG